MELLIEIINRVLTMNRNHMPFQFPLRILTILSLLFMGCQSESDSNAQAQSTHWMPVSVGQAVGELGHDLDAMLQDKKGNYWIGSNGEGLFRYDGKTITRFTEQDGLCSRFVLSLQLDSTGALWISTRDGICRFMNNRFDNFTREIEQAPFQKYPHNRKSLFFTHPKGICQYDGQSFVNFSIVPKNAKPGNDSYDSYAVYCIRQDSQGHCWIGTQEHGVAFYNGDSIQFIEELDLNGPAVRAIHLDAKGRSWFGNNGAGLFLFEKNKLRNITRERGLENDSFFHLKMPVNKPGSMARIFSIQEGSDGVIWIGSIDSGVWILDGDQLRNYTEKDGLMGSSVRHIFKDQSGILYFITESNHITMFHNNQFKRFL